LKKKNPLQKSGSSGRAETSVPPKEKKKEIKIKIAGYGGPAL
jgi:hypothetical protein